MIPPARAHLKTNSQGTIHRFIVLVGLLFTLASILQSQTHTKKPSEVFFGDPSESQIRAETATPIEFTSIGQEVGINNLSPHSIIAKDVVLRGWLAKDPSQDSAGNPISDAVYVNISPIGAGIIDLHYNIVLDYDFIDSTYGADAGVLSGAMLHGHGPHAWDAQATQIPLKNPAAKTASGIDINSFWSPYSASKPTLEFHSELNAWHPDSSQRGCQWPLPGVPVFCSIHNFDGRGPAPAGWIENDYGPVGPNSSHNLWPFDPLDPDGLSETVSTLQQGPNYPQYQRCVQNCDCAPDTRGKPNAACMKACMDGCRQNTPNAFVTVPTSVPKNLQPGEYVEIKGTFWQDITHDTGGPPAQYCWNEAPFQNHGGWLEIHPVDSVTRVPAPMKDGVPIPSPVNYVPNPHPDGDRWIQQYDPEASKRGAKRIITAALCSDAQGNTSPPTTDVSGVTCPDDIPTYTPTSLVPNFLPELVDGRFTDTFLLSRPDMLTHGIHVDSKRPDCVDIIASLAPGIKSAHFKATYVVWWTAPAGPRIINQPADSVVGLGHAASFAVTATGAAPLSYQWQKNGMTISGATSPNYVTPPVTPSDLGAQFAVVVSNPVGSVTSSTAAILGQLSATVSSTGVFSPPVTDTVTVTSNGAPMAGATVSVGNSTFVTNASGVAVITHAGCSTGQPPKVGDKTVPKRTPVPCGWIATVSKLGYQSAAISLP